MPDSTNIDVLKELSLAPETEIINPEDYVIVDREKSIMQMRLGDLMTFVIGLIKTENTEFPEADNLKKLLDAITNKIVNIKVGDILYDGEIHMEYGNLRGLLTYMLDRLDSIDNGIESEKIEFLPDGDTPPHVSEGSSGAKSMHEILNYIMNNYRYEEDIVPGDMVNLDVSLWEDAHKPEGDTSDKLLLQEAMDRLYDIVVNQTKRLNRIFTSNSSNIDFLNSDEGIESNKVKIKTKNTEVLTIKLNIPIICNTPGVLITRVYCNDLIVGRFENALTTGSHTLSPFTYMNLVNREEPYEFKVQNQFIKDTDIDNPISANIEVNTFLTIYEAYDIKVYKEEGGEQNA